MGKKSKKHQKYYKISKEWAEFLVDSAIGPQLSVLSSRAYDRALHIKQIAVTFIMDLSKQEEFADDPEKFISEAIVGCGALYQRAMLNDLVKTLKDGFDLIKPNNNRIIRPN